MTGELLKRCSGEALVRDEERLANMLAEGSKPTTAHADAKRVSESILEYAQVCYAETETVDALAAHAAQKRLRCLTVPELPGDIDRIDGLLEIGSVLQRNGDTLGREISP